MKNRENLKYMNLPIINKGKIAKDEKLNQNNSKLVTLTLIVFIIILLLFGGYSMAKVVEQVILNSTTAIAEPILLIENDLDLDITESNNYGEYAFKVKNYNEKNKVTEIDLKYYIEILSNTDNSVNIELYQNEKKIDLKNNKTDYIQISKDKREEREYKIKITYDKNKSNTIGDIMDKIQVKVHTEQMRA